MFTEEETGIRSVLLRAVVKFVIRAQTFPGISRIALVGSLTTPKLNPKDADLLVTVSDDADLKPLATAGRQLKGALQSHSHGADIFLANSSGDYIGRTCSWKDCRPGIRIRCKALNSGLRPYLYDDLEVIWLDPSLVQNPPIEIWPKVVRRITVPKDIEAILLTPPE